MVERRTVRIFGGQWLPGDTNINGVDGAGEAIIVFLDNDVRDHLTLSAHTSSPRPTSTPAVTALASLAASIALQRDSRDSQNRVFVALADLQKAIQTKM